MRRRRWGGWMSLRCHLEDLDRGSACSWSSILSKATPKSWTQFTGWAALPLRPALGLETWPASACTLSTETGDAPHLSSLLLL